MRMKRARGWVALVWLTLFATPCFAGKLDRAQLERLFPAPFSLGEKDDALPVWPIFKQNATEEQLVAYVFESSDFAPIPGFSGTPIDLLVALTPEGGFLDVKVVSQNEPVFVDGLGPQPLFDFVAQYAGKSLKQSIKIGARSAPAANDGLVTTIDGVAKATASVRILNESLIAASLAVARAKLGFARGRDPSRAAAINPDVYEPLSFQALVARGYVKRFTTTQAEAEQAFTGTPVARPEAAASPDEPFIDLWIAELDAPIVGRNLLGDAGFARLVSDLDGRRALIVISTGRQGFMGDDFVANAIPTRLSLAQAGAPVEIRDFAWRKPFVAPDLPAGETSVLTIKTLTGWNPASPSEFGLHVTREKGQILAEKFSHDFIFPFRVPDALLIAPPAAIDEGLAGVWKSRALDLGVLSASLVLLSAALFAQRATTAKARRFVWFRRGFLLFVLVFVGWRAQAQLSIVTLIGLMRAAHGQGSLDFLLYDPPSLLIWGFALAALPIWGRGTFCGWLCPFGALQELVADAGRALGVKPRKVPAKLDARLRNLKYVVLAALLSASFAPSALAERLAEVEPFKTTITLGFVRSAPFVVYALALLVGNLFVYKFFCRYMCPLGAGLAVVGLARRWDWIARRRECGDPCQLCRVKCRYGAIRPSGKVVYHECFQCLDCVAIHDDPRQCVPLVLRDKRSLRPAGRPT